MTEINRRDILKGLGAAAVVISGARRIVESDKTPEEGLLAPANNPLGRFYPIYEIHDIGPSPSDFAKYPKLDALFLEGKFVRSIENKDYPIEPKGTLPNIESNYAPPDNLKREITLLEKLSKTGKIVNGDIYVTANLDPEKKREIADFRSAVLKEALIGGGLIQGVIETYFGYKILKRLYSDPDIKGKLSRRDFLKITRKVATGLGGAYLLSPFITNALSLSATRVETEERILNSLKHFLIRLHGLQSNLHPEVLLVFVRNIFLAAKILTLADQEKTILGKLPNIGISMGGAHSGIEDWLNLGTDFIHAVINLFPSQYLKLLADENYGAEILASLKTYSFSSDGRNAEVRTVTDQRLKEIVLNKISKSESR